MRTSPSCRGQESVLAELPSPRVACGLADSSTAMVTTTRTENFQMSAQTALLIGSLLAIAYNALRSLVSARNSPCPIIFGERVLP
jgi:hypothetical protein